METQTVEVIGSTVSLKDDFYRQRCDNPAEYDRVVDWIAKNNPAAVNASTNHWKMTAEAWACMVVHSCISAVIFGDAGMSSTTGMAMAIRSANPKKVVLAIRL